MDDIDIDIDGSLCASTIVQIDLKTDPFNTHGVDWLTDARDMLGSLGRQAGFDLYLANGAAVTYDAEQAVYGSFAAIIASTLAVVFCLMGLAFGSIMAPLRSVATLGLTLSFVFGLAVVVYQVWGAEGRPSSAEIKPSTLYNCIAA